MLGGGRRRLEGGGQRGGPTLDLLQRRAVLQLLRRLGEGGGVGYRGRAKEMEGGRERERERERARERERETSLPWIINYTITSLITS